MLSERTLEPKTLTQMSTEGRPFTQQVCNPAQGARPFVMQPRQKVGQSTALSTCKPCAAQLDLLAGLRP